jgi:hypothetical protein
MRKLEFVLLVMSAFTVSLAAQEKGEKTAPAAKKPDEKPAPQAAEVNLMTPSPEVEKLSFLQGTWDVEETMHPGPRGPGGNFQANANYAYDLDKLFLAGRYQHRPSTPTARRFQARSYLTYDPRLKLYRLWWFDNASGGEEFQGSWKDENTLVFKRSWEEGGKKHLFTVSYLKKSPEGFESHAEMQIGTEPPKPVFDKKYTKYQRPPRANRILPRSK